MAVTIGDNAVTVFFVALLVVGSISMFVLYETWSEANPDEREVSRDYVFEGTIDGVPCIGTGSSEHVAFRAGYRVYTYTASLESSVSSKDIVFDLIFDSEDRPDSDLYSYEGKETVDGKDMDVWRLIEDGTEYTFHISDKCVLEKVSIVSSDYRLTGVLA